MPENESRRSNEESNLDSEKEKSLESATTTPKSVIIVPRSKSQTPSRRVTPTSENYGVNVVEKHLPNGDLYTGTFFNKAPHGSGKYLWRDGCMYEGEWKMGKASGKGRFSWPSGATYEGEFKSGRMEGSGTFIGSDGDVYIGSWSGDCKHGYGVKHYSNGDCYEGQWRRNLQDGQGRYIWRNGNEYVGEWKNGVIHGRGVLVWSNGNRFDCNWENGVPKGDGVFTSCKSSAHSTGSCNVSGNNSDSEDGLRGFNLDLVTGGMGRKSLSLDSGAVDRAFPRICIWESEGEAGDITCDILDNMEASIMCRDGIRNFQRNPCSVNGEGKKPGQTVSKGHKNYDLMLSLQVGIRFSVGKHASISRDIKLSDFDPKEKYWTKFPREGSKITPPHQAPEFKWKDYCPMLFRHLRELFQVDPADYMLSVCGNDALRELSSPGKSGSIFYLTQDDRFIIKTAKKSEVKVLIKMLPSYYQHVCSYENSLVTKFYGVHCAKPVGGVKTRFIVMGNVFCSSYQIHRRFDLKGSSHGRRTNKPEGEIDETTTLKDLDLNFVFRLQTKWFQELIEQINCDCEFLEAERIMDYSLLVGLHFRNDNTGDRIGLSPFLLRTGKNDLYQNEKFMRGCRFLEAELQDMDRKLAGRKPLIRLGANMPARAERVARKSDFDQYTVTPSRNGEMYEVILYIGIIDILQDYDISKKLEHAYKSLQVDSTSISAVDPKLYSKRFRDFVGRTFVEDR